MTAANFDPSYDFTVGQEGRLSTDKSDPGNWTGGKVGSGEFVGTWYGLSAAVYGAGVVNFTIDQVKAAYRRDYWNACQCDQLPAGVDLVAFDGAVNSGPGQSEKWIQAAVGAAQDGVIGPMTLAAIAAKDPRDIINAACDARLAFDEALAAAHPENYAKDLDGWKNRVAALRSKALIMEFAARSPQPAQQSASVPAPQSQPADAPKDLWGQILSAANTLNPWS
ncbi:MAG: secretion activator protein [Betaproteobacteria bacterium]|nr:secretion activator protein [Betaproteobacteria bacterium]